MIKLKFLRNLSIETTTEQIGGKTVIRQLTPLLVHMACSKRSGNNPDIGSDPL